MNLKNLDRLIDRLRTLDNSPTSSLGFDMALGASARHISDHPCGSACCIGGHAAIMLHRSHLSPVDALMEFLEISNDQAWRIALPNLGNKAAWAATPDQAADVLETFKKTGEVSWN